MSSTKIPEKKLASWWEWAQTSANERNKKRLSLKLRKNPIPAIVSVGIYAGFLNLILPFRETIAIWLFKFVEFLQIPRVLKLQLLVDPRLYKYSAMVIVGYIAFAFFLDLVRFLDKNLFNNLYWEGAKLKLTRRGWLGGESVRWEPNQLGLQILHKGGVLRRLLGLEKLVFFLQPSGADVSLIAESPYFSSRKNSEFLKELFHS
ncbi:hypothetical protein LEP1GSC058_0975 [Leptospira fainei serovar Hurstbridge str. BUT 6]|uniref:PH domain protein n=1 Tax=Leptospira fainei serovar Hurstbridge str. BUT 6 TaxID=1193011 RepID=S3VWN6_9LEPT|nr:hypothetical protein [Leptospira fainei]EPG72517.1 hypothetical protein LEP1GSC058_0975 [Leptospira fainei serovar Hurstbridge str. BUT 6]